MYYVLDNLKKLHVCIIFQCMYVCTYVPKYVVITVLARNIRGRYKFHRHTSVFET